jgi:sucrose-6-phosphate hydrolase SacC (GH32 family)
MKTLLPDPTDSSLNLPPAQILPFVNTGNYVPQFHFSLPGAAVGDPDGVVRYQNSYHLFTWDHAASQDLVSWSNLGWPLGAGPHDAGYWTGSVVVDKQNTSGLGSLENPPMLAFYTIHDDTTLSETIGMSYSTDYRNFVQYSGNPIVFSNDVVFRDPDVFWDTQTNRWFMTVARSAAHNLHFYSSADAKLWHYEGDFGPVGAASEIWEAPGLVQVPIKGAGNQKKWVLYVGAGTNKVQYYVGNFDGTTFAMDDATQNFLTQGTGLEGDVFANFEGVRYDEMGWTSAGPAFGAETGWRGQGGQPVSGFLGNRLASSYVNGDYLTGSTLTSPSFTITKNCINFLIAGGNHPGQTCINLLVNDQVVRTATGDDSDVLKWAGWNVADLKEQVGKIQIVDDYGGLWGRIYIDQIMFSDILTDNRKEHANWVDYGSDFYAPKVVRDYDGLEQNVTWLGWIGSWLYETNRPAPTNWGTGAESIFRNLQLEASPKGYQLVQQPILDLQKLRGPVVNALPRSISDTSSLAEFHPQTNTYELEAIFNLTGAGQKFGINLCVSGTTQKVVIGYDTSSSNLFLDRTASGYVSFDPGFPCVVTAPFKPKGDTLKLRIFVDQSSIEVFANDGERVFTSQIYPDPSGTGVELFSYGGATTLQSLQAWPFASIWH